MQDYQIMSLLTQKEDTFWKEYNPFLIQSLLNYIWNVYVKKSQPIKFLTLEIAVRQAFGSVLKLSLKKISMV